MSPLDDTMAKVGDVLHYVYDYGDNWDLAIRLEEVRPLADDAPQAACVGGRHAAPPDDCGGIRDAEDLVDVLPDPAAFDAGELNDRLVSPAHSLGLDGLSSFPHQSPTADSALAGG